MAPSALAAVVLTGTLCLTSAWVPSLDDASVLVQQDATRSKASAFEEHARRIDLALDDMMSGVDRLISGTAEALREASVNVAAAHLSERMDDEAAVSEPVSLIEMEEDATVTPKPLNQQVSELKEKVSVRMGRVATGLNKGVSAMNARVEHSVGNMMSKANSAVDDIHSAASNALQGVKDFADAASEPITKKVNSQTSFINGKIKLMIGKVNTAVDDMKAGMRDLAHGLTDGMKEASEKIAAQLAQSVHEHVRQEIELARAAEPASLLELKATQGSGAAMAQAHQAVDAVRAAATDALESMRDLVEAVGEMA